MTRKNTDDLPTIDTHPALPSTAMSHHTAAHNAIEALISELQSAQLLLDAAQPVSTLQSLSRAQQLLDSATHEAVMVARAGHPATWEHIGNALGISDSQAHRRYANGD